MYLTQSITKNQENKMIKGIHHINIVVTNLKEAKDFFLHFGFTIKLEKGLKGEWLDRVTGLKDTDASFISLEHDNSSVSLELLQYNFPIGNTDPNISSPNQIGFRHMALEVVNIEEETERLEKKGIKFFSGIQTNPYGKKMCYFHGPDGIVMEILEL